MKKLLLTSATAFGIFGFVAAANANIGANDSSASCDNSTIGASSGTTTLEAQWQANTITLKWYNDGEQFTPTNSSAAGECTYDEAITLPSNTLSKEGYTFDGWTVKPMPTGFDLTTLLQYVGTKGTGFGYQNDGTGSWGAYSSNAITYGITEDQQWATAFSYGTVKGRAKCSAKTGNNNLWYWDNPSSNWTATEAELTAAEKGKYCWCIVTEYADGEGSINYQPALTSSWIFADDTDSNADACAYSCAYRCGNSARTNPNFRTVLFGGTN